MNINQTIQQSKFDPRGKAITSLVFGIISGAMITFSISVFLIATILMTDFEPWIFFIWFGTAPLTAIIGLIFGIFGLKSTKRNFAITGIVLCVIGLFLPLFYLLFG